MRPRPKVSVIVLNWTRADLAQRSLTSAMRHLRGVPSQFIAVENGARQWVDTSSLDDAVQRVVLDRNQGVARGRNAGIAAATGEYLLILDDDAIVLSGLRQLLSFADEHPEIGAFGPRVVDGRGETMFTCRKFPTALDKVSRRIRTRWGEVLLTESEMREWDHSSPALVDYVIGACQLLRRATLDYVGSYDATCFYGPEDVDMCLRMWNAGWRVAYFPQATVFHEERRVTTGMSVMTIRHATALCRYFIRHRYFLSRRRLYRRLPARSEAAGEVPHFASQ